MQHRIPKISEVNLELVDLNFYFDREIDLNEIAVSISAKASFSTDNSLVFFVHIRYFLEQENSEQKSLFHTDYLVLIPIDGVDWKLSDKVEIDKTFLAHLLGMSFLMIRGAISIRLSSNYLINVQIPIINPMKLLESNLTAEDNSFILTNNLTAHEISSST